MQGKVAFGRSHSLCVDHGGLLWSFGSNEKGQLGLMNDESTTIPKQVETLKEIIFVTVANDFSVCIDSMETLWTFGNNNNGQLGLGDPKISGNIVNRPTAVVGLPPIVSAACGTEHTMCIDNEGNIWGAGSNIDGQLGLGESHSHYFSFSKVSIENIATVKCGGKFTIVMDNDGNIMSTGDNSNGTLAQKNFHKQFSFISVNGGASEFIQFSCGQTHILFLDVAGRVYAAGSNSYGQLGVPGASTSLLMKIPYLKGIKQVFCGNFHSVCIDRENTIFLCGFNYGGILGFGNSGSQTKFTPLRGLKASDIIVGANGHLVRDDSGALWTFGKNSEGQLGLGDTAIRKVPVSFAENCHLVSLRSAKAKSARK